MHRRLVAAAGWFSEHYPRGWTVAKALLAPLVGPLLFGPWPTAERTWELVAYWLLGILLWGLALGVYIR